MISPTRFLAAILALTAYVSASLNPIEVKEQEFVDSQTGDRFVLLGVAYQPGGQSGVSAGSGDPLSDSQACLRDAALMQSLGVNTIRVYNVDPTANHDECVSIFDSVGIYIIIDVNSPLYGQYLNRAAPASSYTIGYLQHIFSVVDAFMNYPNVLGFFSGNEIINAESNGESCPPYIRAVQRDLKQYIAKNAPRTIPVGYSAADVSSVFDQWAYLQCNIAGDNDISRSDFFGLNDYEWCGDASSYTISGYNVLIQNFGSTTIPVFFSEYGCIVPLPRYFDEVTTLYGPQMRVMSGGLVYQWSGAPTDYDLVSVNSNGSANLLPDYDTLSSKFNMLSVSELTSQNSSATSLTPPTCNANLITTSGFSTDFSIPDQPSGASSLIANGVSGANKGSLVSVTATSVPYPVYQTNGAALSSLTIQTGATAANYPGAVSNFAAASGSSASSGSSGSGSTSKSHGAAGAAATPYVKGAGAVAAAALGVVALL